MSFQWQFDFRKIRAGIYVLSGEPDEVGKPRTYKIGYTLNIKRRVNSYHILYPKGVYTIGFLLLDRKKHLTRWLPGKIECWQVLQKMNSRLAEKLGINEGWHSNMSKEAVIAALVAVHEEFSEDTDYPCTDIYRPLYSEYTYH